MSAPANELAFAFTEMVKAAENWSLHAEERERKRKLLKIKAFDKVEPKERLAKRANRLLDKVKASLPVARESTAISDELRELVSRDPISPDEMNNALYERVIGETRDFLSSAFLEKGIRAKRSVGRIVRAIGGGRSCYGTGFLVSANLLMTNCHVLGSHEEAAESTVEFDYQVDGDDNPLTVRRFSLQPERFFLNDPGLDMALVAVSSVSSQGYPLAGYGWCPMIGAEGKISIGDCVNIVQHPRGEMKQIVIRENSLLDLQEIVAHYEGDTEPGSSGSPIFNDQWEVVALHHSGVPKMDPEGRNFLNVHGGIWERGDDPNLLDWVANEGIRVSRLVKFIRDAEIRPHELALRDEFLAATPGHGGIPSAPDAETIRNSASQPEDIPMPANDQTPQNHPVTLNVQHGGITLTIPLTITIGLGNPAVAAAATSAATAAAEPVADVHASVSGGGELLESIDPDPNYGNRPGYDPNFLGFAVPLPRLGNTIKKQAALVKGTNSYELKYYHYSVIMNSVRRIAFVAAVNYDGGAKVSYKRAGDDRWFFDKRIPKEYQAGNEYYAADPYDRGHLVRRADSAWGADTPSAKLANDDTFHFTNCSPQHEVFNQSTKSNKQGMLLWGDIEEHIAKQVTGNGMKISIFNGPVFRHDDPKHRGLPVPREYFKIVVFKQDNGKPRALAFLLSQASLIKNLPLEEFIVGPYAPFQVRVREIESRTNLDFGALRTYDPLEQDGRENFYESEMDAVPLSGLGDIVMNEGAGGDPDPFVIDSAGAIG